MQTTKRWLMTTLLRGLSILVPVAVAVQVLAWLLRSAETMTMTLFVDVFPWQIYLPGMGVLLLCGVVFAVGLLMYPWFSEKLDALFRRLPLFGSVYAPVRDLMSLLGGGAGEKLGYPVVLRVPGTELETIGFVTRRENENLPPELLESGYVVAYVQFASQLGGFTLLVPESACRRLDMSTEDAMRFAITAGLSLPRAERGPDAGERARPAEKSAEALKSGPGANQATGGGVSAERSAEHPPDREK